MRASSSSESRNARAEAAAGPLVSVGIPVFNGERFLRGALDSMLGQSHTNLELILSDNASTDGTEAISREYAARDPRVRYFRQPRNVGAPRNWNFVARQARGTYMKWGSANDYCDTAMFSACLDVLESDPRVVLCHGTTRLVDEVTGAVRVYDGDFAITEDRPSDRLAHVLSDIRLNNALSGLIRMEALRKTGLNRLYAGGDLVMMAELAMAGRFVLIQRPFLYRRIGAGTFSSQLPDRELRDFLDPQAKGGPGRGALRMNIDYIVSALRASMPLGEKWRALALLARRAYWDAMKTVGRPGHASGARR